MQVSFRILHTFDSRQLQNYLFKLILYEVRWSVFYKGISQPINAWKCNIWTWGAAERCHPCWTVPPGKVTVFHSEFLRQYPYHEQSGSSERLLVVRSKAQSEIGMQRHRHQRTSDNPQMRIEKSESACTQTAPVQTVLIHYCQLLSALVVLCFIGSGEIAFANFHTFRDICPEYRGVAERVTGGAPSVL